MTDADTTCPGCGDTIDGRICLLESFERYGAVLCDPCFEARCSADLDATFGDPTPPTDDGSPDEWADIIPY